METYQWSNTGQCEDYWLAWGQDNCILGVFVEKPKQTKKSTMMHVVRGHKGIHLWHINYLQYFILFCYL